MVFFFKSGNNVLGVGPREGQMDAHNRWKRDASERQREEGRSFH
jgi:hypothetical protein